MPVPLALRIYTSFNPLLSKSTKYAPTQKGELIAKSVKFASLKYGEVAFPQYILTELLVQLA